jgi:hypothetical protein
MTVTRLPIGAACPRPGAYPMDPSAWVKCPSRGHAFGVYILLGSQISPKGVAVPVYQGGLQVPWCVGAGGYLWMHSGYQEASID